MALEASARVAVSNAIENKDDLGRMLGTRTSPSAYPCLGNHMYPLSRQYASTLAVLLSAMHCRYSI